MDFRLGVFWNEDKSKPFNSLQPSKEAYIVSRFVDLKLSNFTSSNKSQCEKAELKDIILSDTKLDKSTSIKFSQSSNIWFIDVKGLLNVIFNWTIPFLFVVNSFSSIVISSPSRILVLFTYKFPLSITSIL